MAVGTIKEQKTWTDLRNSLRDFPPEWAFRGQSDDRWDLTSSLERWINQNKRISTNIPDIEFSEKMLIERFQTAAHQYLDSSLKLPQSTLEWLALMQHYGTPTRLLDFTYSPYVATFFALDDALRKDQVCAIWAIDFRWLQKETLRIIQTKYGVYKNINELDSYTDLGSERYFKDLFFDAPGLFNFVYPVQPVRSNERIHIQQGLFLCPGNPVNFEDNFEDFNDPDQHIQKLVISNRWREEIISDLNLMNINFSTLFPGLDGFARSLKNYLFLKRT